MDGQYGTHELTVTALTESTLDGRPRLRLRSNHVFDVRGDAPDHHVWEHFSSEVLARAVVRANLTVEYPGLGDPWLRIFFKVTGHDASTIDFEPPQGPLADLRTFVRFDVEQDFDPLREPPELAEVELIAAQGFLERPLVDKRIEVNDSRGRRQLWTEVGAGLYSRTIQVTFEIEPLTSMVNEGSERNLALTGSHAAIFDQSAELIGVVVEDEDGNIYPDAEITSDDGSSWPVLAEHPPEPEPEWAIRSPVAALGTDLGTSNDEVPLERTIDQSGLDKPFTSGVTDWSEYFDFAPDPFAQAHYTNGWQSELAQTLPLQGTIDYDFGGEVRVDQLVFWNRSLEHVRALFANDPDGPFEEAASFTLESQLSAFFSYAPEIVPLDHEVEARYLRLAVDSAYAAPIPGTPIVYAQLGEIAARARAVTVGLPEPEAGALALAATGTLALLGRRRRRERANPGSGS